MSRRAPGPAVSARPGRATSSMTSPRVSVLLAMVSLHKFGEPAPCFWPRPAALLLPAGLRLGLLRVDGRLDLVVAHPADVEAQLLRSGHQLLVLLVQGDTA